MKRFLSLLALVPAFCSVLNAQNNEALATRTRIAKQGATLTGDRGTFTVAGAETLNPGQFSFGAGWSNFDRTPKDLDINSFPVHLSVGVLNRLMVSAMLETHKQVTARNLSQSGFYGGLPLVTERFGEGLGDTVLSAKFRLQRKRDNVGGLALKGFVKFGTGESEKGLGTRRHDYGAELTFSSLLPLNFLVNTSMGYVYTNDSREPFTRTVRDQLQTGLGAAWPSTGIGIGGGELQGIFEYTSTTFVGCCSAANLASAEVQNPTDITAGVRYLLLNSGLTFDAGYRINTKFDLENVNNSDRHGLIAGISFTRPNSRGLTSNRSPLVGLESDVAEVNANGTVNLTATGFDADDDRLSYTWTATGGQVTGNGERATFRATSAGSYTVRVLVSDGNGGTSSAEMDITVR